jgi:hypothetical protein
MNPQDALSRVIELLADPSTENLERSIPYLEFAADALRTVENSARSLSADDSQEIALSARRVRALHQQAGRIRLGAARLGVVESAGYTCGGRPGAPTHRPNLAITG